MGIDVFGVTDIGRKRAFNEDRFLVAETAASVLPGEGPVLLLAVADGIGGHAGGDVASALAIDTLKSRVMESPPSFWDPQTAPSVLVSAFVAANDAVYAHARETDHLNGMGTTLVAALVSGSRAVVANVGDSRLYHIRGKIAAQVTLDHSWAAEQRRMSSLSDKDISRSPFRNMVTRSIGFSDSVEVDTFTVDLAAGEGLLLCTDGLYGPLKEKDIRKPFRKRRPAEDICRRLIRAAVKAGSRDNITAVAAKIT